MVIDLILIYLSQNIILKNDVTFTKVTEYVNNKTARRNLINHEILNFPFSMALNEF